MTAVAHKPARPAAMRRVTDIVDPGEHWKFDAACMGHSRPEIFYPPPAREGANRSGMKRSQAERRRRIIIAEAKTVCRSCPVTNKCLEYALAHDERYGIWGGKTSKQRGYDREDR